MFERLLVANRGEIACRILHTARRLGLSTVAVYSEADRGALHVELADEALCIGPADPAASYLNIDAVLAAARRCGADAVHPGYGFLSENVDFCRRCEAQGLVFVGPPAAAIACMGSKSAAKRAMFDAGVPVIPGYHGAGQSDEALRAAAAEIGYPVLLKAVAGGGGRGMRAVPGPADFDHALAAARREAQQGFGDDTLLLERLLEAARHIEVQVFCDAHGGGVYLFDRDCSIQRRHQKVLEEAPAPDLDPALRAGMGAAALTAARAIAYRGAGTVEFMLDRRGQFYFMEMNTRLQVEHGVTELICGLDLVEWQLRVAAGEALPLTQEQLRARGHAVEVRIYAEDPTRDFLPAAGPVQRLAQPPGDRHLRIDTGIRQGDEISIHYDPLIAKLMAWDETREGALQHLARGLAGFRIDGPATNLPFLTRLLRHPALAAADLDTDFIGRHRDALLPPPELVSAATWLPLAALYLWLAEPLAPAPASPWELRDGWRLNQAPRRLFRLSAHGEEHEVWLYPTGQDGHAELETAWGRQRAVASLRGQSLVAELDGRRCCAEVGEGPEHHRLHLGERTVDFALTSDGGADPAAGAQQDSLSAPMNGRVIRLLVDPGGTVTAGQALLVLEAMKMEHTLRAPRDGVIGQLRCREGDLVSAGDLLLELDDD